MSYFRQHNGQDFYFDTKKQLDKFDEYVELTDEVQKIYESGKRPKYGILMKVTSLGVFLQHGIEIDRFKMILPGNIVYDTNMNLN